MVETLSEFGLLIRRRREEAGLTLDALAKRTGISKPYLSNIETARAPGPPSEEKLGLLETALGFPAGELVSHAAWLRTPASVRALFGANPSGLPRRADGMINLDVLVPPSPAPAPAMPASGPVPQSVGLVPLPLINRVQAGNPSEYTDLDYPAGVADAYVPLPADQAAPGRRRGVADAQVLGNAWFAARVTGDSMAPEYQEGDVLVLGSRPPRDGDDCLVRLDAGEDYATTFKRVFFLSPDGGEGSVMVRLVPLNAEHAERVVSSERVTGIYPVLWKMTPVNQHGPGAPATTKASPKPRRRPKSGAK